LPWLVRALGGSSAGAMAQPVGRITHVTRAPVTAPVTSTIIREPVKPNVTRTYTAGRTSLTGPASVQPPVVKRQAPTTTKTTKTTTYTGAAATTTTITTGPSSVSPPVKAAATATTTTTVQRAPPPQQEFQVDDLVEYYSSKKRWIDAVVEKYNSVDGTYDLDVRASASPSNIRKKRYKVGDQVVYVPKQQASSGRFQGQRKKVLRSLVGDKYEVCDEHNPSNKNIYHVRELRLPPAQESSVQPVPSAILVPASNRDEARDPLSSPAIPPPARWTSEPPCASEQDDPTTIATAPPDDEEYVEGQAVEYWSQTFNQYVATTVKKVNADGTVDLECKARAQRKKIRAKGDFSSMAPGAEAEIGGRGATFLAAPGGGSGQVSPAQPTESRGASGVVAPATPVLYSRTAGYAQKKIPVPTSKEVRCSKEPRGKNSYGAFVGPEIIFSGSFDPASAMREICTALQLPHEESSIEALTGFKGGMNKGIWFLRAPSRPMLVMKLVSAQRPHPSAETEAENLQRLARERPRMVTDLLVTFPVKLFKVAETHGKPLYDLLVMEAAEGQALVDLIPQLLSRTDPSSSTVLWKALYLIGSSLKKLHRAYQSQQHGDLQPNNVFVDTENERVTFIDIGGFGLSRPVGDVDHFSKSLKLLAGDGSPESGYGLEFERLGSAAFLAGYKGEPMPS